MFYIILFVVVIPLALAAMLTIAETPSERPKRKVSPTAYRLGQWIGRRIWGR
jgi:hypothetical protein